MPGFEVDPWFKRSEDQVDNCVETLIKLCSERDALKELRKFPEAEELVIERALRIEDILIEICENAPGPDEYSTSKYLLKKDKNKKIDIRKKKRPKA